MPMLRTGSMRGIATHLCRTDATAWLPKTARGRDDDRAPSCWIDAP